MTKEEHKQLCKQFWDSLAKQGALDRDYVETDDFESFYSEFVEPVDRRVWKEWFSTSNVDLDRRRSLELSGLRYLDPYRLPRLVWHHLDDLEGVLTSWLSCLDMRRNHYEEVYRVASYQTISGSTKEDPV